MPDRALIAMSGGVDSSVAAYLTLTRGIPCAGVTLRQFRNGDLAWTGPSACCSWRDMEDAAQVALLLGLPHGVLDGVSRFRREVIDRFVRVYESGGTPNPCLDCNRCMRAGYLLDYAAAKGFSLVVTGHYARVVYDPRLARWLLLRGVDPGKDQSYVHYAMTQDQLARTRFPLGALRKAQVRALAARLGLPNASKPDSQDICFVPDGDYAAFLERYTGRSYPPGDFLDLEGRVIGRHRGAARYTIGQRRGLGLSGPERRYVCGKDMARNTVTVGPESALYAAGLFTEAVNWIVPDPGLSPLRAQVQTRYRQRAASATLYPQRDGTVRVDFDRPHRAVTPGQAAVFYRGNVVLGGGVIRAPVRG